MADRIVVMNHGAIEQVGTPRDVYERAGDAVRRGLRRQGQRAARRSCVGGGRYRVGNVELDAPVNGVAAGDAVRLYLRPEDRVLSDSGPRRRCPTRCRGDRAPSRVPRRRICLASIDVDGFDGQQMLVYVSLQPDARARREGRRTRSRSRCAAERVRVFSSVSTRGDARAAPRRRWRAGARAASALARPRRAGAAARWLASALLVFLLAPLAMILVKSVQDKAGAFVGLANFASTSRRPALAQLDLEHAVVRGADDARSPCRSRSCSPTRIHAQLHAVQGAVAQHRADPDPRAVAAGGDLVHLLFGNQGVLKGVLGWFGLGTIYGLPGIVLAMMFATFPHALMILLDGAARCPTRGCTRPPTRWRTPRVAQVLDHHAARRPVRPHLRGDGRVHVRGVSDFGIPKVIGGNFNVLAIDIFKQVIGQQNFNKGAVVGLILLRAGRWSRSSSTGSCRAGSRRCSRRARCPTCRGRRRCVRPRDARVLLLIVGAAAARRARHGDLRLVRQGLAVRPVVDAATTTRTASIDAGVDRVVSSTASRWRSWCAVFGAMFIFAGAYLLEKTRGVPTACGR